MPVPAAPQELASRTPLRHHLGHFWISKDTQLLSRQGQTWIFSKTGKENALENFGLFENHTSVAAACCTQPRRSHTQPTLLDDRNTLKILEALLRSGSTSNCLLPCEELWKCILNGCDAPSRALVACVWALSAYMSVQSNDQDGFVGVDSYYCATMARSTIAQMLGKPSMELLQAVLLLVSLRPRDFEIVMLKLWWLQVEYYKLIGNILASESLHALGCRVVCELGCHRSPIPRSVDNDHRCEALRLEHTRKLSFAFYASDSDISLRTGKPPLLPEEYCDFAFRTYLDPAGKQLSSSETSNSCQHDLCIIKQRVSRLLHSPATTTSTDAEILESIRTLDAQLEDWRLSVSPDMRPKILSPPESPQHSAVDSHQSRRSIDLQLDYCYVLVVLHSVVRRCCPSFGANKNIPEDLHEVIHSSIDVSLEGARTMLRSLKIITEAEVGQAHQKSQSPCAGASCLSACRRIFSFAPLATLSIFMNILLHPFDERCPDELEALAGTASLIQGLPFDVLSEEMALSIEELCEFVVELGSLAHQAIWRAKRRGVSQS